MFFTSKMPMADATLLRHVLPSLLLLSLLSSATLGQFYSSYPSYSPFGRYPSSGAYSPYSLPSPMAGGICTPVCVPSGGGYYGGAFSGKPSYSFINPYGGGYGISGYEGPAYGMNSYWQPGVAYPPYAGGANYYQGMGSIPPLLGGGCRDRVPDCALLASTGQCASGASSVRALCPLSCGLGCAAGAELGGGLGAPLDIYGRGSGAGGQFPLGFGGHYPPLDTGSSTPFYCRDSHIFGCQQWAQQGLCQSVPEFMLNYCRASCGLCGGDQFAHNQPYSAGAFGQSPFTSGTTQIGPETAFFNNGFASVAPIGPPPAALTQPTAAGVSFSTDQQGGELGSGVASSFLLPAASSNGLYSPYFPYYPFRSGTTAAASSAVAGAEQRKEKQQRTNSAGTKLMFSEDAGDPGSEFNRDMAMFSSGLPQSIGGAGAGVNNAFGQSQRQQQQSGASSALSGSNNPSQLLPPSTVSTQHSSVSKLVRMDDLLKDKKKKS